MSDIFPIIILNGRPAAGKSEIIDFLKSVPLDERKKKFHIGEFEEFDDFPILWERFEDDDLYQKNGKDRVYSNDTFTYKGETLKGYCFKERFFWDFLLQKLSINYSRRLRDNPDYHKIHTAIFEFARGSEHGGWIEGYPQLSDEVLSKACTIYIDVTWEESLRKNRRRYNPDKPDSILEHALEDKKMEMLYKESDWEEFSSGDPYHLIVKNHRVPYAIFNNMPEITDQPDKIATHLEEICGKLWKVWKKL